MKAYKGLVTGILISIFYGLITIGPVNFQGRILVALALVLTAILLELRVLKSGAPWYLPGGTLGGYHSVARPFTVRLSWGTKPIYIGTIVYIIGCWAGWWR